MLAPAHSVKTAYLRIEVVAHFSARRLGFCFTWSLPAPGKCSTDAADQFDTFLRALRYQLSMAWCLCLRRAILGNSLRIRSNRSRVCAGSMMSSKALASRTKA